MLQLTQNNGSILNDVRNALGDLNYKTAFDETIVVHINSVFSILHQLNDECKEFKINNSDETWNDFNEDNEFIDIIKEYVFLKVKLIFDPPNNFTVLNSIKEKLLELESRIETFNKEDTD